MQAYAQIVCIKLIKIQLRDTGGNNKGTISVNLESIDST